MKILPFPELRQVYLFDCGANELQQMLVFAGINEREDAIMKLAGTDPENGTSTAGVLQVFSAYNLPHLSGDQMMPDNLRRGIDAGHPTILTLQAYRDDPGIPYSACWNDGHWVAAIGYYETGIIFDDPAAFTRTWLDDAELCERWHDLDSGDVRLYHWGCTLLAEGKFIPGAVEHME